MTWRRTALAWRALLSGLACLSALCAHAQDGRRPLFESGTTLTVTLQADWPAIVRTKNDPRRHPAVLGYADAAGRQHRIDATVETRGLTRRRICRLPPLRIRFARDATRGTEFEGQRSLKMVTHCRRGAASEQLYVKELLAYRIFNHVTDHSFRVRPLAVTYVDAAGGAADGPRFAFLVEDLDDVARRNGHRRARRMPVRPDEYEPMALTRFMMFQYLIGNTDWEVLATPGLEECCHNVRLTAAGDATALVAVPYDFDSAGLVDAGYAVPDGRLPIRSVTDRLYRGFCGHNDSLEPVRAQFLASRDAVLALVRDEARLSDAREATTLRYFGEFYATLEDPARFAREISGKCRR